MRVFLVGTDTSCGKTSLACALVRAGEAAGLRVLPFKPAASGPAGPDGDPERLAAASSLGLRADEICPLRFAEPLAPGVADDPAPFLRGPPAVMDGSWNMADRSFPYPQILRALSALETATRPDLTIIEGAGGLWVPMPGGTWLPAWISALAAAPVVVGRLGLGTVNHTLLTITGLARAGLMPRGFYLVDTGGGDDPSRALNPALIAAASGVRCLGVLGHGETGGAGLQVEQLLARSGR